VIDRILPVERTTDFPNSGPLNIRALNTQLDRFVAFLQQFVAQVVGLTQRVTAPPSWVLRLIENTYNSDYPYEDCNG